MNEDAERSFNCDPELRLVKLVSVYPAALRTLQRHGHKQLLCKSTVAKEGEPIEDDLGGIVFSSLLYSPDVTQAM